MTMELPTRMERMSQCKDDGTDKEDGKDVADVKVIGTVSVNGKSAEESSDDTYPSSDEGRWNCRRGWKGCRSAKMMELPTRMERMSQM
jgi:hypothetical protein